MSVTEPVVASRAAAMEGAYRMDLQEAGPQEAACPVAHLDAVMAAACQVAVQAQASWEAACPVAHLDAATAAAAHPAVAAGKTRTHFLIQLSVHMSAHMSVRIPDPFGPLPDTGPSCAYTDQHPFL